MKQYHRKQINQKNPKQTNRQGIFSEFEDAVVPGIKEMLLINLPKFSCSICLLHEASSSLDFKCELPALTCFPPHFFHLRLGDAPLHIFVIFKQPTAARCF